MPLKLKSPILLFILLLSIQGCKDGPLPCIEVKREKLFMGADIEIINCSESDVKVDFNKEDELTEWNDFEEKIIHQYSMPGTYFMYFEFEKNGKVENLDVSFEVTAPEKSDLKGDWRLWVFEDRTYGYFYPGLDRANPFESTLEETWEVNANWDIQDTSILASPDFTFCLLCFGPENYTYFEDQAEISVGSILSNIIYFDGDSMILDAGYGGDPFLIYMSRV